MQAINYQPAYIDALKNLKSGINDREFLVGVCVVFRWMQTHPLLCITQLEKLLILMSRLPDDSVFAKQLQISVIGIRTCSLYRQVINTVLIRRV
jgi:hypothetical protein